MKKFSKMINIKVIFFLSILIACYIYQHPIETAIIGVLLSICFLAYINYKRLGKYANLYKCRNVNQIIEIYKESPTEFEHFIGFLFEKQGYKVKVTNATNDCGKDLIMWYGKQKYVVEVKLYKHDNSIGRPLIQKLHSAAIDENAIAIFVTTSYFADTAIQYANKHGIWLISGYELEKIIKKTISEIRGDNLVQIYKKERHNTSL